MYTFGHRKNIGYTLSQMLEDTRPRRVQVEQVFFTHERDRVSRFNGQARGALDIIIPNLSSYEIKEGTLKVRNAAHTIYMSMITHRLLNYPHFTWARIEGLHPQPKRESVNFILCLEYKPYYSPEPFEAPNCASPDDMRAVSTLVARAGMELAHFLIRHTPLVYTTEEMQYKWAEAQYPQPITNKRGA